MSRSTAFFRKLTWKHESGGNGPRRRHSRGIEWQTSAAATLTVEPSNTSAALATAPDGFPPSRG